MMAVTKHRTGTSRAVVPGRTGDEPTFDGTKLHEACWQRTALKCVPGRVEGGTTVRASALASSLSPRRPQAPTENPLNPHVPAPTASDLQGETASSDGSAAQDDRLISLAPDGSAHPIPSERESRSQFEAIAAAAGAHRARGGQVVVVQGLGFVGCAVCAAVASATDERGDPLYFVIGVDLPTPGAYWKVAKLKAGQPTVVSPDVELVRVTRDAACRTRTLTATSCEDAYDLADVILVDIHLDVTGVQGEDLSAVGVDLGGFEVAMRTIGSRMRPDALVMVETTVPVGTCETVVLPILQEERARRGFASGVLLAHAYERVMPGPRYLESVRAYWRTFSGVDASSALRAEQFLSTIIDTEHTPLWQAARPTSSELAKLLENSYRAMTIAFAHEWTLLAEQIGVNLFEVVDSIRVRKGTHDNMRYPGLGVGGYCLTKDSLLAQWGATHLLGADTELVMTLNALQVNAAMPDHTAELALEMAGGDLSGAVVAVCGVSYIADVADTRSSPSARLIDGLRAQGADVLIHDPWVREWTERPDLSIIPDLADALRGVDGVILAVAHGDYVGLAPQQLLQWIEPGAFVVDAQNIVDDDKAALLHSAGLRLTGVGKGHWRTRDYQHAA